MKSGESKGKKIRIIPTESHYCLDHAFNDFLPSWTCFVTFEKVFHRRNLWEDDCQYFCWLNFHDVAVVLWIYQLKLQNELISIQYLAQLQLYAHNFSELMPAYTWGKQQLTRKKSKGMQTTESVIHPKLRCILITYIFIYYYRFTWTIWIWLPHKLDPWLFWLF